MTILRCSGLTEKNRDRLEAVASRILELQLRRITGQVTFEVNLTNGTIAGVIEQKRSKIL